MAELADMPLELDSQRASPSSLAWNSPPFKNGHILICPLRATRLSRRIVLLIGTPALDLPCPLG